jgi:predicted nucleic acid-binding Zn ribbon protein
MPIYEYRRPDGTTFELRQTFSEEALVVDPDTGVPVERVLHPPAVHFKGKGFYNTDYGTRNRQRENAAAAESSSDSSSSSSSSESGSSDGAGKGAKDTKSDGSSNGAAKGTDKAGGATDKPAKPVAAKK